MTPETESPPETAAEAPTGEGLASPHCSEPERRRVVIEITCEGTSDDADAIRDAIGDSLDDDHLMPLVMEVMERRGIQGNTLWEVKGDRWVPAQNV